ncbi:MAG: hypothetical protein ABR888_07290 [Thermoplasmata archaeon]
MTAAARQYYLIARLDGELGLRALEKDLTRGAAPFIVNLSEFAHGFDYSARKPKAFNALTVVAFLIGLVILLVFIYAWFPNT